MADSRHSRTAVSHAPLTVKNEESEPILYGRAWGRKAILAGWVITMFGVVGYVFAMMRAPEGGSLLDALRTQGTLGFISLVLLLAGVITWIVGNVAFLRETMDLPSSSDDQKI